MPNTHKEEKKEVGRSVAPVHVPKKTYLVLDSNGNPYRHVEDEEKANYLVKVVAGRIATEVDLARLGEKARLPVEK